MALVVQKYGGTSVANIEKITNVAEKVARAKKAGNDVIVVVSAMAGETDRLIGLAHSVSKTPNEREYDVLVSTGEQVTISLLAMVLEKMGLQGEVFSGVADKNYYRSGIYKGSNSKD